MSHIKISFIRIVFCLLAVFSTLSCTSVNTKTDYSYLDDNLSDRWDLAKKVMGEDVIYIDTSNYGKIAKVSNTGLIKSENLKIKKSVQSSIEAAFKIVSSSGGKIAISGYSSVETHLAIVDAFNSLTQRFDWRVQILYIGDKQFKSEVQRLVVATGARFLYAKQPATSL